jgi:hypothetical protein
MLVDLTDLVVDLPIVGLAPRPDAFGYGTPTKVVFITRQTRIAGACPKPGEFGLCKVVGLTWQNPNSLVLVEGPELTIQPLGVRRLPTTITHRNNLGPFSESSSSGAESVAQVVNEADVCADVVHETVPSDGTVSRETSRMVDNDLLKRARQEDARHWEQHRRPISTDTLRKRLRIGAARSRMLVSMIRADRPESAEPGQEIELRDSC